MNRLQDPNFILGLAVGVITFFGIIVIPLVLYWRQQARKELSYELIPNAPILHVEGEVREYVEVRLRESGQVLDNLNQVAIKFKNSGNRTIRGDEFDVPIQIIFDENTTVISTNYSSDASVSAHISFSDAKTINLVIDSLNPQEEIVLFVLVTEYKGEIQYKAHIVGGTFSKRKPSYGWRERIGVAIIFANVVSLFFAVGAILVSDLPNSPLRTIAGVVWVIIAVGCFLIFVFRPLIDKNFKVSTNQTKGQCKAGQSS